MPKSQFSDLFSILLRCFTCSTRLHDAEADIKIIEVKQNLNMQRIPGLLDTCNDQKEKVKC